MKRATKWLIITAVAAVVLALAVLIPMAMGSRYERSVEHWQQERYLEAAKGFYALKGYRDSEDYLRSFEEKLIGSLSRCPWRSEEAKLEKGDYEATGTWQFLFRGDYTGTENHLAEDSTGTETVKSYEFTYKFQCNAGRMMLIITYEAGEEAPYLLTVTEENGALNVEKLYGAFQFYETYIMADYLPEQ